MLFIFPCDVLNPMKTDEHFSPEADAVREIGHSVKLINFEALTRNNGERVMRPERGSNDGTAEAQEAIYRGWMLTPTQYEKLSTMLAKNNITLRTSAEQYEQSHELMGWYDVLRHYTPNTVEIANTERVTIEDGLSRLNAEQVWLRDYSKSIKDDLSASWIRDTTDINTAVNVIRRFEDLRGEDLAGNILLREFEYLDKDEIRTWWKNGQLVLVTNHPNNMAKFSASIYNVENHNEWLPEGFEDAVQNLATSNGKLSFVTADFAKNNEGIYRLVELGDGQVSDLDSEFDRETFIQAIS